MNNGHDVTSQPQASPQQPTELQSLFIEAMFWRQKYFELRQHTGQVIDMLSRPAAGAAQLASMLGQHPPETGENVAQNGAQPQESASPVTSGE